MDGMMHNKFGDQAYNVLAWMIQSSAQAQACVLNDKTGIIGTLPALPGKS